MSLRVGDRVWVIPGGNGGKKRAYPGQIVGLGPEEIKVRFAGGEERIVPLASIKRTGIVKEIIERKRTISEKVFGMIGTELALIAALIAWIFASPFIAILSIIRGIIEISHWIKRKGQDG